MRLLITILFLPFRLLPQKLVVLLGRFLGFFLHHIFRFRLAIVTYQLGLAFPEKTPEEMKSLITGVYRNLGINFMEFLAFPLRRVSEDRMIIHNKEIIDQAMQEGRGVIILSAHFSNWELTMRFLGNNYPVHTITKEFKSKFGEALKVVSREKSGIRFLPRRNSMKDIMKALKANECVLMVIDQNMTRDEGIFVDFFGIPACTMSAVSVIGGRMKPLIVPVSAYRDDDLYRYHITVHNPVDLEFPSDDKEDNNRHNTQILTRVLEDEIRQHPDQWLWIHKRWKRPGRATAKP